MKHRTLKIALIFVSLIQLGCENPTAEMPEKDNWVKIYINCSQTYESIGRDDTDCDVTLSQLAQNLLQVSGNIHIRGNSSALFPKRPFRLKLDRENSIVNMPPARSWVLLANYADRSMIRNALAFRMSEDSQMDWIPHAIFAELYFNNSHKGTYQLCEKVQVHPNRLTVPSDGCLVEIDGHVKEGDFYTPHITVPFHIRWPEQERLTTETSQRIEQLFVQADNVLFGDNFADPEHGWREYMDETSFIEWYLINEIAKNNDAIFFSSCYMHVNSEGKIVMGPVWDFDLAYGNSVYNDTENPQGWHVRTASWYTRLFEDAAFRTAVRKRFDEYYSQREVYIGFIRQMAVVLRAHVQENEEIWHTMNRQIKYSPAVYSNYDEAVDALITWLNNRFEWMNENLNP